MMSNVQFGNRTTSFISKKEKNVLDLKEKQSKKYLENTKISKVEETIPESLMDFYISKFAIMTQTHSNTVLEVNQPGVYLADGIITKKKNLKLTIQTADCMPVFISDNEKVGAIHIGWKGLENKIFHNAISKFEVSKLEISIGPHAKKCCYEVKKDLYKKFKEYCTIDKNSFYLDLSSEIVNFSKENNINVSVSDICTIHDERFYSYRRDQTEFRQLSQIWI